MMKRARRTITPLGKKVTAPRGKAVKKKARKAGKKKVLMPRSLVLGKKKPLVLESVEEQAKKIVDAAQPGAVSTNNCFVYFAAFDGTNNDAENAGNVQNTNVYQLWTQFNSGKPGIARNIGGNYFAGPGTRGALTHSSWLSSAVTEQVEKTAGDAYRDFASKASAWLKKERNRNGSVTALLTSFSRGVASAAIFSQLLHEKGLIDPKSAKVLIEPGQVPVSAAINFDPVATGVKCNIAFAPNTSHIVNIRAQDEYRQLFKAVDYSAQKSIVTTIPMLGNHCDIGGGYDDGIAALTLEAATSFLQNAGLQIGPLDPLRKFRGVASIAIHSEDADEGGKPESKWNVYLPGPQIETFSIVDDLKRSPRLSAELEVRRANELILDPGFFW